MMQPDESYYWLLLKKYIRGELTDQEANLLFDFFEVEPDEADRLLHNPALIDYIKLKSKGKAPDDQASQRMEKRLLDAIHLPDEETSEIPIRRIRRIWWAAAAAIFLLLSAGGYLWMYNSKPQQKLASHNKLLNNDFLPGGNKAILVLSDGSKIILDSASNGMLSQQGDAKVVKLADGQVTYNVSRNTGSQIVSNTMTTPKGGQYKLRLPDGTDAWLNSASSITYPTVFVGKERKVSVTGEVYFEVAKNKRMPFLVKVNDMEVQVLGTHFNINAYGDEEAIKTTLLEGSIKLITGKQETLLSPGQQAVALSSDERHQTPQRKIAVINKADLEQVMAWRNGLFSFNNADIKTIMRQLSRWYDVEVVYEGNIPDNRFGGDMPMDAPASQVLRVLQKNDVHFRIDGKKIIVTP